MPSTSQLPAVQQHAQALWPGLDVHIALDHSHSATYDGQRPKSVVYEGSTIVSVTDGDAHPAPSSQWCEAAVFAVPRGGNKHGERRHEIRGARVAYFANAPVESRRAVTEAAAIGSLLDRVLEQARARTP